MARNEVFIAASPEDVFAVLADAESYGDWVVGAERIRGADAHWPAPGSRFRHRFRIGPLAIDDETAVEESERPVYLRLRAFARPLGSARVTLSLQPEWDGTRVTMVENPGDCLTALVFTPLMHLAVRVRNAESLRRLKRIAEQRRRG